MFMSNRFRTFIVTIMQLAASDPMCKRLKLDDFLLAPVKHLAHYPMLLEVREYLLT